MVVVVVVVAGTTLEDVGGRWITFLTELDTTRKVSFSQLLLLLPEKVCVCCGPLRAVWVCLFVCLFVCVIGGWCHRCSTRKQQDEIRADIHRRVPVELEPKGSLGSHTRLTRDTSK